MRARIYKPAKTAMSSGTAKTHEWVLEFVNETPREIDPLTGWTGSKDMQAQVKLRFESQKEAEAYARDRGIEAVVLRSQGRKANIRPGGYGDNFATNRRGSWTH